MSGFLKCAGPKMTSETFIPTGKGATSGGGKGCEITKKERGGQETHQRGEGPYGSAHSYPGVSFGYHTHTYL